MNLQMLNQKTKKTKSFRCPDCNKKKDLIIPSRLQNKLITCTCGTLYMCDVGVNNVRN